MSQRTLDNAFVRSIVVLCVRRELVITNIGTAEEMYDRHQENVDILFESFVDYGQSEGILLYPRTFRQRLTVTGLVTSNAPQNNERALLKRSRLDDGHEEAPQTKRLRCSSNL